MFLAIAVFLRRFKRGSDSGHHTSPAMHLNFPDLGSGALPDEPSAAVTVHFRQGDSVPALVAWLTSGSGSTTPCRLTLDVSDAKLGTDGGRQLAQALASNCAVTSVSVTCRWVQPMQF
jgi:hypothetical protein